MAKFKRHVKGNRKYKNKHPRWIKRKFHKKPYLLRHPFTGLDRLYRRRMLAFREEHPTLPKIVVARRTKHVLRLFGPTGRVRVRRIAYTTQQPPLIGGALRGTAQRAITAHLIAHVASQRTVWLASRKYRLKFDSSRFRANVPAGSSYARLRAVRQAARLAMNGAARVRRLAYSRHYNLRAALRVRKLAAHRRRIKRRRRWLPWYLRKKHHSKHKGNKKQSQSKRKALTKHIKRQSKVARGRKSREKALSTIFTTRLPISPLARYLLSACALRRRAKRIANRSARQRYTRRAWWRTRIRNLRRRYKRYAYADVVKKARWRRVRRDKAVVKVAVRAFQARALAVHFTAKSQANLAVQHARNLRHRQSALTEQQAAYRGPVQRSSSAFLRSYLRQLVLRKKSLRRHLPKVTLQMPQHAVTDSVSNTPLRARVVMMLSKKATARTARAQKFFSPKLKHYKPKKIIKSTGKTSKLRSSKKEQKDKPRKETKPDPLLLAEKKIATRSYRRQSDQQHRESSLAALTFVRVSTRALAQRTLRRGKFVGREGVTATSNPRNTMSQVLLRARGQSRLFGNLRVYRTRTLQNAVVTSALVSLAATATPVAVKAVTRTSTELTTRPRCPAESTKRKHELLVAVRARRSLRFLEQSALRGISAHNIKELRAAAIIARERRAYREMRTYRRRPKLRLPGVAVSRTRKRHSGLATFARNSLRVPKTLLGRKRLLLPPISVYSQALKTHSIGHTPTRNTLTSYHQRVDNQPIFWRRTHNRANAKAVGRVRRRKARRYRRIFKYLRQNAIGYIRAATTSLTALRGSAFARALSAQSAGAEISANAVSDGSAQVKTLLQKGPALSNTAQLTALLARKETPTAKKIRGLWQARSVRAMLKAERALSAWSPQMSARNRRAHYPRVDGLLPPRRLISERTARERRANNAKRLRRGIPERRYTDHTRVKLQYFYGSVGSTGYARFRRVHRMHSEHSRWWRVNTRAVPFAHPFSRRDLNATHYRRVALSKTLVPSTTDLTRHLRVARGTTLHTKQPPRRILWRNFGFRRPKFGAKPITLERWTFTIRRGKTSRVQSRTAIVTLARTARERHGLHKYVSVKNTWKNRRWAALDKSALSTAGAAAFQQAIAAVPGSVWTALQEKAGSIAAYASIRAQILSNFRNWIQKRQKISVVFTKKAVYLAQQALIGFMGSALKEQKTVAATLFAVNTHQNLRANGLENRAARKSMRFMQLRELPRLGQDASDSNLLVREQSRIYKHWLAGAEGAFKRTQAGYTPTSRSRYSHNVATTFGRRRLRFPASGRRRKSYDSLLHAFAKKIGPARLRRTSKLSFRWVTPRLVNNFKENAAVLTPLFGANRRRETARKLSAVAYLAAPLRELLQHRAATHPGALHEKVATTGVKRRFMLLPIKRTFKAKARVLRKATITTRKHPTHVARAGILRRALRRRRRERAFLDLRIFTRRRRLPREKNNYYNPPAHRQLRRFFTRRRGNFSHFDAGRRFKTYTRWTLNHLCAVGSKTWRRRSSDLPAVLNFGENVSVRKTTMQKKKKALRGFVLPTHPRRRLKLRRLVRDTRRRRRFGKRSPRVRWHRSLHWSDKRDRRVRGRIFSYRSSLRAKSFAKKLVNKFSSRELPKLAPNRRSPMTGLTIRSESADKAEAKIFSSAEPSAALLDSNSYLQRHATATAVGKQNGLTLLQVRSENINDNLSRRRQLAPRFSALREQTTNSVAKRLVATANTLPTIAPLWFESPVTHEVKSAAVREQEIVAAIAAKEGSFKLPMQYIESVTAFIPELMNFMMSHRIKNKQIGYDTAQQLVRNIYWSLRVYLNVDPFDKRFFVRDKVPSARVSIFENIISLASAQKMLQPQRAALRYRFQPARLVRSQNTMRFREDWLRAFFPARHALFQENADDYGHFLLKTSRIRRLRIGARGVQSWITAGQLIGEETRARQLLRLRFSRSRPRFETTLQTTRRIPTAELSPSTCGNAVRTPFFARHFSTYANRSLAVAARWLHRQKRFVSVESSWRSLPPTTLASARRRIISRVESRGKTNYGDMRKTSMTFTLLDDRFTRSKSPRNRQYVIRSSKKITKTLAQKKGADVASYANLRRSRLRSKKGAALCWTRARRRSLALSFAVPTSSSMLDSARRRISLHRAYEAFYARVKSTSIPSRFALSALNYRTARARTAVTTHKKPLTLLQKSVGLRSKLEARWIFKRRYPLDPRKFPLPTRKEKILSKKLRLARATAVGSRFAHKRAIAARDFQWNRTLLSSRAGVVATQGLETARGIGIFTKVAQQAPFEARRPALWNDLTVRWKKKLRIGRYWLRDTSHWLRDPWLSKIVAPDMSLRRDRFGGEFRSRQQQVGEYVADVDDAGRNIRRQNAPKERHKYQNILPEKEDKSVKRTLRILKHGSTESKLVTLHRLPISKLARRKPAPTMRLANYEFRDVIREHKEEKAKSRKQKEEEEQARVAAYWARKQKGLGPERQRRLPLKHPANLWLPHVIWKDIQRRIRKLEWRESDEVFVRWNFWNAFRFSRAERRKAPWLESLMYTRATYSTRLKEFRRRQFPHEQKRFKWLQRVRKVMYPGRFKHYLKGRRWSQLRRYNQKLFYSLFNFRDGRAARRHFKRLSGRTRPAVSSFVSMSNGLTNKLANVCLDMRFAPSAYWARIVSTFGLLRVNGTTVYDPNYRLKSNDVLYPNWDRVARFQHYFQPYMQYGLARARKKKTSTAFYSTNMEYHRGVRALIYKHRPDESDLRKGSRVNAVYFRGFKQDPV